MKPPWTRTSASTVVMWGLESETEGDSTTMKTGTEHEDDTATAPAVASSTCHSSTATSTLSRSDQFSIQSRDFFSSTLTGSLVTVIKRSSSSNSLSSLCSFTSMESYCADEDTKSCQGSSSDYQTLDILSEDLYHMARRARRGKEDEDLEAAIQAAISARELLAKSPKLRPKKSRRQKREKRKGLLERSKSWRISAAKRIGSKTSVTIHTSNQNLDKTHHGAKKSDNKQSCGEKQKSSQQQVPASRVQRGIGVRKFMRARVCTFSNNLRTLATMAVRPRKRHQSEAEVRTNVWPCPA